MKKEDHKRLGVELFNSVWTLLDKRKRTVEENDRMVHAAHASRYHWEQCGKPVNLARGEWQVSRVYSVLRRPEAALYHAKRCLEICRQHGIGDFDLAFAYEALARASRVAGKSAEVRKYLSQASAMGEKIREKDDREYFFRDLSTIR